MIWKYKKIILNNFFLIFIKHDFNYISKHFIFSSKQQQLAGREDMIGCVMALEAAMLPCLPAREFQAIDPSPHHSHQG